MGNQIFNCNVLTIRDCLKVLFLNKRIVKTNLSVYNSVYLFIDECAIFRKKHEFQLKIEQIV